MDIQNSGVLRSEPDHDMGQFDGVADITDRVYTQQRATEGCSEIATRSD